MEEEPAMTTCVTKEEAKAVADGLAKQYGNMSWFRNVTLDDDGHGVHVVLKVRASEAREMGVAFPTAINGVKICTISVG